MPSPLSIAIQDIRAGNPHAVVGFDGFVDEITRVIAKRLPTGEPEYVPTIAEFGAMISAAAGRSFGREIITTRVEGGGNGPNFADGLLALGASVDLIGTLGQPRDAAFDAVAAQCRSCTSIGTGAGRTIALEFGDGKLMMNETSRLGGLDAAAMNRFIDEGAYTAAGRQASIIGLCNWSKYPHMAACWRVVHERVLSTLTHRPWVLIDLADPAGRTQAELREVLALLTKMQTTGRVLLGANLHESALIAAALGVTAATDDNSAMQSTASHIREHLRIEMVVIHSQRRAAGAWSNHSTSITGAYTGKPVRTTGVGDRFNAGLMWSLANGNTPDASIAMGCAAGGFFVRHGHAGTWNEIRAWTQKI